MQPLTSAVCLEAWERGRPLHWLDRGLLALRYALPEVPADRLADWPLGRRNQALLELYRCSFGPTFEAWSRCVHCGEPMEMELDALEMVQDQGGEWPETLEVAGHSFRLPSSRSLGEVARFAKTEGGASPERMALRLAEACRVAAGEPLTLGPEELVEIEAAMAEADPLAEIRLALECPACGGASEESLEVTGFLWARVEVQAKALLGEVHALALAYGWNEAEVLALGDTRRRLYVEMVDESVRDARVPSAFGAGTQGGRRLG